MIYKIFFQTAYFNQNLSINKDFYQELLLCSNNQVIKNNLLST